jgi:2-octaprenyl-6-methoxyphenol hydroxylase
MPGKGVQDHIMADHMTFDVAVIGAGPAGLIAGLALAQAGLRTSVVGPHADPRDGRTSALFQASITLLARLGVWDEVVASSEPLSAIRLVDATGSLLRAPEVTFHAREVGIEAFGYNVPNAVLTAALDRLCASRLERIVTPAVGDIVVADDRVTCATADGQRLSARLIAAADGRQSPSRTAAGIAINTWNYQQSAVVCTFEHSRPHGRISTEFHRRCGPLTVVPAPGGKTSNLVWVDTPAEAQRLAALDDIAFARELESHLQGLLGSLTPITTRRVFPLSGQTAETMGRNRVALIGEAGHVIPPIGAQGLNLSMRDAATLADCVAVARANGRDIGDTECLNRYAASRRSDVTSRVWTVDLLNRSLLSPYTTVQMLRGLGLFALSSIAPLRQKVMREGISPQGSLPSLMQPSP